MLAQALKRNTKCEQIVLADNEVGASLDEEVNTISLVALGEALVEPTAGLIKVRTCVTAGRVERSERCCCKDMRGAGVSMPDACIGASGLRIAELAHGR